MFQHFYQKAKNKGKYMIYYTIGTLGSFWFEIGKGGRSCFNFCFYFLLPKAILIGNKLN